MKKNFSSKLLCLLLALTMILPMSLTHRAFATPTPDPSDQATYELSSIDEKEWDFDAATNTLKGFKNKTLFNNPQDLVIPDTIGGVQVKVIGKNAFQYSTLASGKKIKNPLKSLVLPEGLEKTEYMCFQCNDIKEIKIPKSLKILGERTFYGNKQLNKVDFNDTVNLEEIGPESLQDTNIEEIIIPECVKKIGIGAFKGTPLKKIQLPESLEEIGGQAFALCMLEEFTVPKDCKKIGLAKNGKPDGAFFRNFYEKDEPVGSKGKLRLTKVYDSTGNANVLNTYGVVNPQPITFRYVNEDGETVMPEVKAVGYEKNVPYTIPGAPYSTKFSFKAGDGHLYLDYIIPFIDGNDCNVTSIYNKENVTNAIIGENYFVLGGKYEFEAPNSDEYIKPEKQSITLSKDNNVVEFVYKDAGEKYPVTLEGKGLSTNKASNKFVAGKTVTVKIAEPEKQVIESFTVDGKNHLKDLVPEGVGYIYSFEMPAKAVKVSATYKNNGEDSLSFVDLKDKVNLGDSQELKVKYKGREFLLPNKDFEVTIKDEEGLVIKGNKLFARMAGKNEVSVKLLANEKLTVNKKLEIDTCDVYLRFEDINATVVPNTLVKIDKLFLKKDVGYYTDLEFDHPVPVLAMEKLLKANGVDTSKKDEFDCGLDGGWMLTLGKFKWAHINDNGSFMYLLNEKLASMTVADLNIKSGDKLCVFYNYNWKEGCAVGEFETKEYTIDEGETIKLKAFSHKEIDKIVGKTPEGAPIWDHVVEEPKPIVGGRIEVRDEKGEVKKIDGVTDSNGEITVKMEKAGTYNITLFKEGSYFSRPLAVVKVKSKTVGGGIGGGGLPQPQEKDDKKDPTDNNTSVNEPDEKTTPGIKTLKIVASSTKKTKGILIRWNKVNGVDGYEVWRSVNKNKGYKKMYSTKANRYYNTKGLKKGVRYFYKVRGYKLVNGKKTYTSWSNKAIRVA